MKRSLLLLVLTVSLPAGVAQAKTFNVTKQTDSNDGACTATKCSLRDAVIASNATAGPSVINLGAGDYKLSIAGANEDHAATGDLDITQSLTVKGAGASTTKIDAQKIDRVFHVYGHASFTLSGVTVAGGAAVPASASNPVFGGGVYDFGGGPLTILNSVLADNHADNTDGLNGEGGAIATDEPLTVTNTTLTRNQASGMGDEGRGGAIELLVGNSATLTHVTATNNHAGVGNEGFGGVVDGTSSDVTTSNSTFTNNIAGGAGQDGNGGVFDVSSITDTGSVFRTNHAGGDGGPGFAGVADIGTTASFTHSFLTGNTAGGVGTAGPTASADGFGGVVDHGSTTFTDTTVIANTSGGGSSTSTGFGGAVDGIVTATRSTFANNRAGGAGATGFGGAIDGPTTLTDSTLTGNSAGGGGSGATGFGGAVDGPSTLVYSDIIGNTASPGFGGGVDSATNSRGSIIADNTSPGGANCGTTPNTSQGHNLENGTSCGFASTGDLNASPEVAFLANNGGPTPTMRLIPGSPAIDHGETSGCPATDQRGIVRPVGSACDIGSYEVSAGPQALTGRPLIGLSHHVALTGSASNHDVVAGTAFFEFGKTKSYGSRSSSVAAPANRSSRFSILVGHLAAGKLYHYRLVVQTPDGTGFGADRTFKTPSAPKLSKVHVKRLKSGFAVSYTDSQAGTVTFTVLRKGKKVRSFKHAGKAGHHKLGFGKGLPPGSYKLRVVAKNGFGSKSKAVVKGFRVK